MKSEVNLKGMRLMMLKELIDKLDLKIISGEELTDKEVSGCYISDLLSLAMSRIEQGMIWITVQTNINIVAVAVLTEASAVIVAEGIEIDKETIDKAEAQDVVLLSSPLDAFSLACKVGQELK